MNFLYNLKEKGKKLIGETIPPPVKSVFVKDGRLTPQEFLEAGDKLISVSHIWKWKEAKSGKQVNKHLPASKQVLCSELISRKRLNRDIETDIGIIDP